jgi:hypothetical protein
MNLRNCLESTRRPPRFSGGDGRYDFQITHFNFN